VLFAALATAGLAAACTPVTQPSPTPATQPKPQVQVAAACPGLEVPTPTPTDPVDYVAVVETPAGTTETESFTATSEVEVEQEVAALETTGTVVSVSEDLPVHTLTVNPDDERYFQQWGLPAAQFDAAWAASGLDGSGVTIAVVDTGIDTDHPEFAGRVLGGQRLLAGDGTLQGATVEDDHGHGTHVAGIAAAADSPPGVGGYGLGGAPAAWIVPVKVLKSSGSGASADVAEGIRWAADEGGADVINLSLGGGSCTAIGSAVNEARALGAVVVAAAGNSSTHQITTAPGGLAQVVSVGASNANGARAGFSNYGQYVDVGAPGDSIWSTVPVTSELNGFGLKSGTSMSSPFVAAAVALLEQKCPGLSPDTVEARLKSSAGTNVPGLGARRLDVNNLLAQPC